MLNLSSFKKKTLSNNEPSLSITDVGVTFNKQCIVKLEYAEKVDIYVDKNALKLVIKKTDSEDGTSFVSAKRKNASYVRWNNADFKEELFDWCRSANGKITKFTGARVTGEYYEEDKALLFDFLLAKPLKDMEDIDLPF